MPKNIRDAIAAAATDDLQYITEGDLLSVLKPIQARRLFTAWAQSGKYIQIELLCVTFT